MVKHTQAIRRLSPTNCLSVFDHFMGLVLKALKIKAPKINPCDVPVTSVPNHTPLLAISELLGIHW